MRVRHQGCRSRRRTAGSSLGALRRADAPQPSCAQDSVGRPCHAAERVLRDRIQAHAHQQAANLRIRQMHTSRLTNGWVGVSGIASAASATAGAAPRRCSRTPACGDAIASRACAGSQPIGRIARAQMQKHIRTLDNRLEGACHWHTGRRAGTRALRGKPYTLLQLTARAQMQKHIRTLENRLEGACHRHNARRAETRALRGVVDSLRRERLALDEALRKLQRGLAGQRRCLAALLHEARRRPLTGSPAATASEPA